MGVLPGADEAPGSQKTERTSMLDGTEKINNRNIANVAPLRNVKLLGALIQQLQHREPDMPGMGCFHGFSGYGKSSAATYNAQVYDACWVEVKSVWSRKVFVRKVAEALGLTPAGLISDMVDQIGEELAKSGRPLLLDEAHQLCRDEMMGVVHDIYVSSHGSAMVLIGEEMLPQKLKRWERIHNRMLGWPAAQPADLRETAILARLKQPALKIGEDVLQVILEKSAANYRRIVTNLNQMKLHSLETGRDEITMADVPKIEFFVGEAPTPRRTGA